MSDKTEFALSLFAAKFNCAQSVFATFAEDGDVETETALRIAGGFVAGVTCGEICGAASGGVMAIGARYGQYIEGDAGAKLNCRAKTEDFLRGFKTRNGGCLTCRELLGYNVNTEDGRARFMASDDNKNVCQRAISAAVELLEAEFSS